MKSFEIHLDQRPKRFDLQIYSMPLRDSFSIDQEIAMVLDAKIEKLVKSVHERMTAAMALDAQAAFSTRSFLSMDSKMVIKPEDIRLLGAVFDRMSSFMQLSVSEIPLTAKKSAGSCAFRTELDASVKTEAEKILRNLQAGTELSAAVLRNHKRSMERADTAAALGAVIYNLFQRSYTGGASVAQFDQSVGIMTRRARKLSELDNGSIFDMDNMDLAELDYVVMDD